MSKLLPIFKYPGGYQVSLAELAAKGEILYKWADSVGGEFLKKPLAKGTINPVGRKSSCGVATHAGKVIVIEYHKF